MSCHLCHSKNIKQRKGIVRDLPEVSILECDDCGLVFLSSFDHIHHGFYENAFMRPDESMEEWISETTLDDKRRFEFLRDAILNKDVLDFGAGTGGFLRLARTVAKKTVAVELDKEAAALLASQKVEHYYSIDEIPPDQKFDLITAFHVIEHLRDPIEFLQNIAPRLSQSGRIYLEFPNANDALLTMYESDSFSKFTYWGCHLMLFNHDTIRLAIEKAGLKCINVEQIQRYPLSNHMYWLAKNSPGGHNVWKFLADSNLEREYAKALAKAKICDTLLVEVSL